MSVALTTARQEIKSLRREKLAQALLIVFVGMVSLSSLIGWLTNRNVTAIWQKVKSQGFTAAPNPFSNVSELYYLRNTVIYLVLVGALLAIVLGVASIIRDRKAHTIDLVLIRPISTLSYLFGKLTGIALWLVMILSLVACVSWTSIAFIIGKPLTAIDSLRLLGFFAMSLAFLLGFVLLGMICAIYSSRETSALLMPICVWSIITFVLPQLGTADHPVSLLNPVPAVSNHGGAFSLLNAVFSPLSVTEQFKKTSSLILGNTDFAGNPTLSISVLALVLIIGTLVLLTSRRERLRRVLHE